jgi:hypothetical protein
MGNNTIAPLFMQSVANTLNASSSNMFSQFFLQFFHPLPTTTSAAAATSPGAVVATLLCPPALFLLLNMFISSFQSVMHTKSNVSAFALAHLFHRLAWHGTSSWLRVFSFVLILLASFLVVLHSFLMEPESASLDEVYI